MKILNVKQIRKADEYTIKYEPIASIDLMERAASRCSEWIEEHFPRELPVHIFCGIGNNGGDGLVIARLLRSKGFEVNAYLVKFADKLSDDCQTNFDRLEQKPKLISETSHLEELNVEAHSMVVDAIFGSGLSREVEGIAANLIKELNSLPVFRLSIDIPSGLFSEDNALNNGVIFHAHHTLSFELPKLAFLLPEKGNYVGDFSLLDIGLDKGFLMQQDSSYHYMNKAMLAPILRPRFKFSHKGTYGHALLVAGSTGKMGAAALAARACLRSGAGLVTAETVKAGVLAIQTSVPEAMTQLNEGEKHLKGNVNTSGYNAVGIGPGIGTEEETETCLKLLIQNTSRPLLIDADGINLLAENKTWLAFLPKESLLTPHPGEFQRLVGKWESDLEAIDKQIELSKKYGIYLVLKGAHTRISCPDGRLFFNSTGNPGMATAGSGDVLTGIILGLLAQGYSSEQASILGVYLHGLSGDLAAEDLGYESLIAPDIIEYLPKAFTELKA